MRILSRMVAVVALLAVPVVTQAAPMNVVIDFNSAPTGIFVDLIVGDFKFTWIGFGDLQQVASVGPGNNALLDSQRNDFGAEVVMSRVSGDPFTVTQFDILSLTPPPGHMWWVEFGGVQYDEPASQTVLRNDLIDVTSLRINIVSLDINFAVDNIHVTYGAPDLPPTTVPEPASLGLVGLGLLAACRRLRRARRLAPGSEIRGAEMRHPSEYGAEAHAFHLEDR